MRDSAIEYSSGTMFASWRETLSQVEMEYPEGEIATGGKLQLRLQSCRDNRTTGNRRCLTHVNNV